MLAAILSLPRTETSRGTPPVDWKRVSGRERVQSRLWRNKAGEPARRARAAAGEKFKLSVTTRLWNVPLYPSGTDRDPPHLHTGHRALSPRTRSSSHRPASLSLSQTCLSLTPLFLPSSALPASSSSSSPPPSPPPPLLFSPPFLKRHLRKLLTSLRIRWALGAPPNSHELLRTVTNSQSKESRRRAECLSALIRFDPFCSDLICSVHKDHRDSLGTSMVLSICLYRQKLRRTGSQYFDISHPSYSDIKWTLYPPRCNLVFVIFSNYF